MMFNTTISDCNSNCSDFFPHCSKCTPDATDCLACKNNLILSGGFCICSSTQAYDLVTMMCE
jgi:hypothetical protein